MRLKGKLNIEIGNKITHYINIIQPRQDNQKQQEIHLVGKFLNLYVIVLVISLPK